jgi:hypothetical protein
MKLIKLFEKFKSAVFNFIFYRFKVDIVYTYANEGDSEFVKNFNYWKEKSGPLPTYSAIDNRYKNFGEFKYSLRSLQKFAPWIKNIYILTSTKIPSWLDINSKKIKIIQQKEIMPQESLPSFNSFVIELYLTEIPGLSEHFIYFNDDCFLGNYVQKSDFFTKNGKSKFNFDKNVKKIEINPENVWQVALFNSFDLIKKNFGFQADSLIHQAHPFLKSCCKECNKYFKKEIEIVSKNKFRALNDFIFNSVVYSAFAIYKKRGIETENFKGNQRFINITDNYSDNEVGLKDILEKKPKLFCLNDGTYKKSPEIKNQVVSFLENYFPEKSEFEL